MFKGASVPGLDFLVLLLLLNLVLFSSGLTTFEPCKPADPNLKNGAILTTEWLHWAKFYSYCLQVRIITSLF